MTFSNLQLSSFGKLVPQFPFLKWLEWIPVWYCDAVAHPLQGLTCCVFRDAVLSTTIVMRGSVNYCCLPVSQSGHSPLTYFITKELLPAQLDIMCFFHNILCKLFKLLCVIISDQQFEVLNPPRRAPTIIPRSKSYRWHFFPSLMFGRNSNWTSWPYLHAFTHWNAATWLAN